MMVSENVRRRMRNLAYTRVEEAVYTVERLVGAGAARRLVADALRAWLAEYEREERLKRRKE
jgi:hypothetical protein